MSRRGRPILANLIGPSCRCRMPSGNPLGRDNAVQKGQRAIQDSGAYLFLVPTLKAVLFGKMQSIAPGCREIDQSDRIAVLVRLRAGNTGDGYSDIGGTM